MRVTFLTAITLALLIGTAACGSSPTTSGRAALSALPTASPSPSADYLGPYRAAFTQFDAASVTWQKAVQVLVHSGSDTAAKEGAPDNAYADATAGLENTLLGIRFPAPLIGDLHALVTALAAFEGDLRAVGSGNANVSQTNSDLTRAQAAINIFQTDLGIGTNTLSPTLTP